jgi:hypothetical protein
MRNMTQNNINQLALLVQEYLTIRNNDILNVDKACARLYAGLEYTHMLETLFALLKRGPLEAGEIPSKAEKAILVEIGMCISVINKGEWCYAVPGDFDSFYSWYLKNHK